MAWLSRTSWVNTEKPVANDINNLGLDIRTWGDNVNAGRKNLTNLAQLHGDGATNILQIFTASTERLRIESGKFSINQTTIENDLTLKQSADAQASGGIRLRSAAAGNNGLVLLQGSDHNSYIFNMGGGGSGNGLRLQVNETQLGISILSDGKVGIKKSNQGSNLGVASLPGYANNAAAIAGGLTAGDLYMATSGDPRPVYIVV